jgi:hypothetical protein
VFLQPEACDVDGKRLSELAANPAAAPTADLETAVTRFTGAFLADLGPLDAFRFEAWRVAEDKALARARAAVFQELLARHTGFPEARVRVGHLWAQQDPLDSRPHAAIIEALTALGRKREALAHYERCVGMLRGQGSDADTALREARAAIGRIGPVTPGRFPAGDAAGVIATASGPVARPPLAGRMAEMERFERLLDRKGSGKIQLLRGEPGIGKTRLLEEMADRLAAAGWSCLRGRAFEAERGRAFGPWIDASAALAGAPDCPLFRSGEASGAARNDPDTLHASMSAWLEASASKAPLALILDDVHWLDAASVGLWHYLARSARAPFRLMLASMRSVAAPENGAVENLMIAMRREGRLETWDVGPLDAADTAQLLRATGSRRDPAAVFARSQGHPLSSLALSLDGQADERGSRASLEAMLDERIRLAGEDGRIVLQWAVLIGRGLPPALLESLLGLNVHVLLERLDRLEAQGLVRVEPGKAGMEYLFGHDLIRERAAESLSAPRRQRMHAHVARVLRENLSLARGWEEVAAHAEAGAAWKLAAEACLEAGRHCSRLYAFPEAESWVSRGLEAAEQADGKWPLIQGLCVLATSVGAALNRFPEGFDARLTGLIGRAKAERAEEAVLNLLSCLSNCRYLSDQPAAVSEVVWQTEAAGANVADPKLRAFTLGDMATCLFATDQDIQRARQLALQAEKVCAENGITEGFACAALAMLAHREGRLEDARAWLQRGKPLLAGHELQVIAHYHWSLAGLIEIESEDPPAALACAERMRALGEWVRNKADFHFPDAIAAMAKRMLGDADAEAVFEAAAEKLRACDCKVMTAYLLLFWCEQDIACGRFDFVEARGLEAIAACEPLGRIWEPAWARALMGLAAIGQGDADRARRRWEELGAALKTPGSLPARVLGKAEELALALDLPV